MPHELECCQPWNTRNKGTELQLSDEPAKQNIALWCQKTVSLKCLYTYQVCNFRYTTETEK